MSISQRFIFLKEAKKLSNAKIANICNVSRANIDSIVNGKSKPGFEIISLILKSFTDVNARWFITGEGEPFTTQNEIKEPIAKYGSCDNCNHLNQEITYLRQQNSKILDIIEKNASELDRYRARENTG